MEWRQGSARPKEKRACGWRFGHLRHLPGAGAADGAGALRSHHVPRLPEAARAAGVPLLPAAGAGGDQRPLHRLRGAEFDLRTRHPFTERRYQTMPQPLVVISGFIQLFGLLHWGLSRLCREMTGKICSERCKLYFGGSCLQRKF